MSARHPHLLEFELNFSSSGSSRTPDLLDLSEQLNKNLEIAPMQKLSHKVLHDPLLLALINPNFEPTLLGNVAYILEVMSTCQHVNTVST